MLLQHISSYYSVNYLNTQMAGLELGYMESKNRPSLVTMKTITSKCNKLKQEGTVFRNSQCIVVEVCTKLNFYCFCLSV